MPQRVINLYPSHRRTYMAMTAATSHAFAVDQDQIRLARTSTKSEISGEPPTLKLPCSLKLRRDPPSRSSGTAGKTASQGSQRSVKPYAGWRCLLSLPAVAGENFRSWRNRLDDMERVRASC